MGFPNGPPNKEPAYKARDTGVADWIPGLGKSPVGRNGNPCSVLAWKIPRGAWQATVQKGCKESGMTERLTYPAHTHLCERESVGHSVMSTLCEPMGSSVLGILQARILEWVAIPFSRGSS